MHQDMELQDILSMSEKCLHILSRFKIEPQEVLQTLEQFSHLTQDYLLFLTQLIQQNEKVIQHHFNFWQDALHLLQHQFTGWPHDTPVTIEDKRFTNEAWLQNPIFNFLSQQYLLVSHHVKQLIADIDFKDESIKKRIVFFTQQYLDALSPDHFLITNPQIMQETLQSHGKNLLIGFQNLLADVAENPNHPMIAMTDKQAFKLGINIATTPGDIIFRNDLMELIQYRPQTSTVKSTPLLIIPPWINKYYILDLSHHNSFVNFLVSKGLTVFMISWVNPGANLAHKSLYDYLNEGPSTALDVIQKQLKVSQVNTLGFCIGGTLLSMLLAYDASYQNTRIRTATFLASLIDFSEPGDMGVFIDESQIQSLEAQMQKQGYLDGRLMTGTFNLLRSKDLIWPYFIKRYLEGRPPIPFDILFWNSDATNMPATMHGQYLRWMYLNNDLIKPNQIVLNGTPLNIKTIQTPAYFISTQKDHIAPWKTTYLGFQLFSGKKHFLLGGSGHIAGIVIPPGTEKYGYYMNDKQPNNPDEWLSSATYYTGSWWPEWFNWIYKNSGRLIKAPDEHQLPFQSLFSAPGQYVSQKYDT